MVSQSIVPTGLGRRIAKARTDAGIRSQMEFARRLGVTRSAVSEWERDKSKPSTGNLSRIAHLTGKGFDWLATGRAEKMPAFNVAPADPLAKVALDRITPDTPLRLNVAAALAYPDGSMTAQGLRKEATNHCGEDIDPKRLEALPTATRCISCAENLSRH
jgi:transcriptional regulator with XRE-family HTH domain